MLEAAPMAERMGFAEADAHSAKRADAAAEAFATAVRCTGFVAAAVVLLVRPG